MPVDSWAAIFDPKIVSKLNKRVTVLDSQAEVLARASISATRSTTATPSTGKRRSR